jgi:hypothetical protein
MGEKWGCPGLRALGGVNPYVCRYRHIARNVAVAWKAARKSARAMYI